MTAHRCPTQGGGWEEEEEILVKERPKEARTRHAHRGRSFIWGVHDRSLARPARIVWCKVEGGGGGERVLKESC